MKKVRQAEIDSAAKGILRTILCQWSVNPHTDDDFAKDYLVECKDQNGLLTGSSFYVQLKGTDKPKKDVKGEYVSFPLETKYATYYLDKVKDLPVFLVVIDVKKQKGWWVFIQPVLAISNRWRANKSVTIRLPIQNDLADLLKLERAVEEAKAWMRKRHPLVIGEAIEAERERLISIDPRFQPELTIRGTTQHWTFNAKETVTATLNFKGDFADFKKKLDDLREKGVPAEFTPEQGWLTGSPLFETKEWERLTIQSGLNEPGELTMVTKDATGKELGRLSELPGTITGGTNEQWYKSGLCDSLLNIEIGPMGKGLGGKVNVKFAYAAWSGHQLSQLPYFDRLHRLFSTLPNSSSTEIECFHKGTRFFNATIRLQELEFAHGLASLLDVLSQARQVCEKFGVDPIWNLDSFTQDDFDTIEELYGVFFRGGCSSIMGSELKIEVDPKGIEAFDRLTWPDTITRTGYFTYTVLGEKIDVGRMHRKMTRMMGSRDGTTITLTPTAKSELIVTQAEPESAASE